jgi:hypothetical protein
MSFFRSSYSQKYQIDQSIWLVIGPHKFITEAERSEFSTCLTSDHFHAWLYDNGYGNFTWVWSATTPERTKNIDSYIRSNRSSSISSPKDTQAFAFRISGQTNTSNLGVHKA